MISETIKLMSRNFRTVAYSYDSKKVAGHVRSQRSGMVSTVLVCANYPSLFNVHPATTMMMSEGLLMGLIYSVSMQESPVAV